MVERGALESADNREVVCRVKAGNKTTSGLNIKWVIDDGAQVKQGDLLMEIEDSALQDQLKAEKIILDQAKAAWVAAEENYKITVSQNESLISNAQITYDLAKLNLNKYLEGDYPQSQRDIEGRLQVAEADLKVQQERFEWAERMFSRNYLSESQLKSEESRLQSLRVTRDKVREESRVLEKYTKPLTVTDLTSKMNEAERALERAKNEARAKEVQAESDRQAKKSVYEQELDKYQDIEEQIRRCIISAPQDGMVVYYVSEQSRFGSGSQQSIIAQGEPVKEGQKLMRIPDLRRMLVNTKVHEAMVSRIKGDVWQPTGFCDNLRAGFFMTPDPVTRLMTVFAMPEIRERLRDHEMRKVADGQKATIRIDAFPGRVLQGHVKTVATVAAKQDWNSADVKVYQTMVAIDESLDGLKPDMSAEVTIHIESAGEHVLTVPLQAVLGGAELGRVRKVFVMEGDAAKERDITIGLANEKVVEVKEGLKEGEQIVLNPKALLGDKAKTRQVIDNERGGQDGESKGKGKGKGKGGPGGGRGGPPDGFPGNGGGMPPGRGGMAK